MKFNYFFNKTALCMAVEKNYYDIAQVLLENSNIDVNIDNIFNFIFLLHFNMIY